MSKIIEIDGLKKNYGSNKAVVNISFSVEKGSLFAFLGVNGAGKSTTINIICSILKKDAGKVKISGFDLDKEPEKIKPLIGVVFQNSMLDPLLSVKENLTIRAGFYGLTGDAWRKRLAELSELFELDAILKKPLKNLSGGQKRRVDIVRGLINFPQILILDEPTTGLDPQTRLKIWDLIESLQHKQNMTVFLTTHYMEEADKADNVVMIDHGHIVANDTPHNLKTKFSSDYIKAYMPKNEAFEAEILAERGVKLAYNGESYRINVSGSEEARDIINRHSGVLTDFEVLKGDMDDVFLNITGKKFK